ncbi:hypothetical protein [Streptomyces sp. NBC_01264]|uniref:hypothetical protein n=1 Tax=Streptomyces sp. NBC_01264 TaxID=2903804 RepID=UPI00225B8B7F|nr:hypothetical protein [Streptomyces sp. NBC_01264]MCX4777495.1 hypothetical protein [Streptomyces sp. NBC_01264]
MSAPTHPVPAPLAPRRPSAPRTAMAEARLPWWGLALPALAFGLLLILLAGSGQAHAASGDGSVLVHVTERLLSAVG